MSLFRNPGRRRITFTFADVKRYVSLHNVSAPLRLRWRRSGLRKHSHVLSRYSITYVVAKHYLHVGTQALNRSVIISLFNGKSNRIDKIVLR